MALGGGPHVESEPVDAFQCDDLAINTDDIRALHRDVGLPPGVGSEGGAARGEGGGL